MNNKQTNLGSNLLPNTSRCHKLSTWHVRNWLVPTLPTSGNNVASFYQVVTSRPLNIGQRRIWQNVRCLWIGHIWNDVRWPWFQFVVNWNWTWYCAPLISYFFTILAKRQGEPQAHKYNQVGQTMNSNFPLVGQNVQFLSTTDNLTNG